LKIIFNLFQVGLNNNGGSHTLVNSANTLSDLGNEVIIVDSYKNYYTWNELRCKHLIIKDINEFPNADIIIATGMKSLSSTEKCKIKNKFVYIRGWETWVYPEGNLVNILKQSSCVKIVNSTCLQNKLASFLIPSYKCFPGYDLDEFYPNNKRNYDKITLGGLFNSGGKRKTKRTEWILQAYHDLKKKYDISLYLFGVEDKLQKSGVNFIYNPSKKEKNNVYNKINIWLATSELEGLHITPAEAMLTECCIIGTNTEMAGTQDYLWNNSTGIVTNNDYDSFINGIEKILFDFEKQKILGKNARNRILEIGDRKKNMKKFMQILENN
jgi:glycosyltransferase involved in cell wall biosynthesis